MKRFIGTALVIYLAFILQTTIFQSLSLADVSPNILLIVTVSFAYIRENRDGIWIGFFSGLLMDAMYGEVLGLYALILMIIGFVISIIPKDYFTDNIFVPMILVGGSDFFYGFSYFVFEFLLRGRTSMIFYFSRIVLPEIVYTVIVSIVLYKLLYILDDRLEGKEV
ncbi:MAG: rod shape-determining protein MreD [Lachnospiraceae bacterium]|nr:rod shape-determining protein MreD [Lachnospiraceae bacterium]